jgi:HPt (histidine-containing phosphotransfer) domain-containing protein
VETERPDIDPKRDLEKTPPVDLESFRRTLREAGIEDAADAVLDVFMNDAPTRMGAVSAAMESGNAEEIRLAAHAFKSAAGTIEAHQLFDLLKQLEAAGREERLEDAAALFTSMQAAFTEVREYLQQEIGARD